MNSRPAEEPQYLRDNRDNWDDRAGAHAESPDYRVADFADPAFLSDVVRFDLPRLGDVSGLTGVHLQCHIGTDTISLARLGARMTGLDLSPESIRQAGLLADRVGCGPGAVDRWVISDVYDAVAALGPAAEARYDLIYVSMGAIGWLPSIDRWAGVVATLLRPGGRLFIRDGHPACHSISVDADRRLVVDQPYFEHETATIFEEDTSYVATTRPLKATRSHFWSHGLGELVTALLDRGMRVTGLTEHDSAPFAPFGDLMEPIGGGEFRLREAPERVPLTFTLQAVRES